MNLITWNVRGLGRPSKRFLVKDFLHLHFADVCCLQESKLEEISPSIWREVGGGRLDQFFMVPAHGSAGGIIISWNSAIMSAKLLNIGTFSLTMEFCSKRNNLTWRCTSVYGPNARNLKPAFWDELRRSAGPSNVP
ncbi:RNA-directed DNA polymerase protein [Dioscorea alata]|uniref:RNA-directed DNA polymerase protein n=1 Tax=Dioscorea alata TaxID=55571 RepID=A0ACB7WPP2_DIOAL|nr:RNA-directed DNA polymerase protein [Dioscorea alata]